MKFLEGIVPGQEEIEWILVTIGVQDFSLCLTLQSSSCTSRFFASTHEHKMAPLRGFFKEILELHKRGGLGDEVPEMLKHIVVYCNKF